MDTARCCLVKVAEKTGYLDIEEQPNGEYCGLTIYGEDSGDGVIYYPIEDSTQYMRVAYSF